MQLSKSIIHTRALDQAEWPLVMCMEAQWPEHQRASESMLRERYEKFPEGFMLAWHGTTPVGMLTCVPISYDADRVCDLSTWDKVTNNGYFHWPVGNSNALYIASGVVHADHHDKCVFEQGIQAVVDRAKAWGYNHVLAGARLPTYHKYQEKHGELDAAKYAALEKRGRLIDPLLQRYRTLGFAVPNANHVKASYYPDFSSMDYAAIVVKSW